MQLVQKRDRHRVCERERERDRDEVAAPRHNSALAKSMQSCLSSHDVSAPKTWEKQLSAKWGGEVCTISRYRVSLGKVLDK